MNIGFFTVFRRDPQHFLHATGLVATLRGGLPRVPITQFTDEETPAIEGVMHVRRLPPGPMLERRLEHYAACEGNWLLLDTDTDVIKNISDVFLDPAFDLAIADRNWSGVPQGDTVMHTMPYNTGVCFSRSPAFWQEALAVWRRYPASERDWTSEQRAVYQVIRSGQFRVKILPGAVYNYPPSRIEDRGLEQTAILHYKGPRKNWRTTIIRQAWEHAQTIRPFA